MKFTIDKNLLVKKLKFCNEIISDLTTIPSLSGILINVEENKITLTSSNQTTSCKIEINNNITISSVGKILIKGNLLFNIISKLSDDKVTFNLIDNSIVRISTKTFTSDLNLLEDFSYPLIDFQHNNWKQFILEKEFLNKIHSKLTSTTLQSFDQTNVLTGIYFNSEREDGFIEATSTDSFHLTYLKHLYKGEKVNFILSLNEIKILNSILQETKSNVNTYLNNKEILFQIDDITILSRIIDGQYPSITKILKNNYDYKFLINKKKIFESINRGIVLVTSDKKPIIQLNIEKEKIITTFKNIECGSCYEEIEIKNYNGPEANIYLNAKFLLDLIKNITSDEIEFNFVNSTSPIILKDLKDQEFIGLIVPRKNI